MSDRETGLKLIRAKSPSTADDRPPPETPVWLPETHQPHTGAQHHKPAQSKYGGREVVVGVGVGVAVAEGRKKLNEKNKNKINNFKFQTNSFHIQWIYQMS